MKKIIIAALAIVTTGFCASPAEPVNQISLLHGCPGTSFEGKTAVAIATPSFTGSGQTNGTQFLMASDDQMYNATLETARQALLAGKRVVIDYPSKGAEFNYQTSAPGGCFTGGFYKITTLTLQRN